MRAFTSSSTGAVWFEKQRQHGFIIDITLLATCEQSRFLVRSALFRTLDAVRDALTGDRDLIMTTLPLTVLVGFLLGIVLARWVPSSSVKPSQRLLTRLRSALLPVLTLSIGLWLPAALCIYQEASDWSLMYLLVPERATPTVLAALFTLLTASVPGGLALGVWVEQAIWDRIGDRLNRRFGERRGEILGRLALWGLALCSLSGVLLGFGLCSDRILWVGSFSDFHDGRWLLASLGRGSPRLLSVVVFTNAVLAAGFVLTARAIAGRHPAHSPSGGAPVSPS